MLEGAAPARSAGVRHRSSACALGVQSRETPAGADWRKARQKRLQEGLQGSVARGQILKAPEEHLCSILPRQDGTCRGSERTPPEPPRRSLCCEADECARGPQISECSEEVWGGLVGPR